MATQNPPKNKYKVKFSQTDVPRYMSSRQDLHQLKPEDIKQEINNDLLQIISNGIDDIVLKLKTKLGDNFEDSNAKAFDIKQLLDVLKQNIDMRSGQIGKAGDGSDLIDARQITVDAEGSSVSGDATNPNFYRRDVDNSIDSNAININPNHDFMNLDNTYRSILPNTIQRSFDDRSVSASTNEQIETRLKNCQSLEFLYLKKHDEIMKIFAFTINLFDKYKYAIKVILFLLKNLVYKDPSGTIPTQIKLPLPIISNIKKLVDDQNAVQGIIDNMQTTIKDSNLFKDAKQKTSTTSEEELDKKILKPL